MIHLIITKIDDQDIQEWKLENILGKVFYEKTYTKLFNFDDIQKASSDNSANAVALNSKFMEEEFQNEKLELPADRVACIWIHFGNTQLKDLDAVNKIQEKWRNISKQYLNNPLADVEVYPFTQGGGNEEIYPWLGRLEMFRTSKNVAHLENALSAARIAYGQTNLDTQNAETLSANQRVDHHQLISQIDRILERDDDSDEKLTEQEIVALRQAAGPGIKRWLAHQSGFTRAICSIREGVCSMADVKKFRNYFPDEPGDS